MSLKEEHIEAFVILFASLLTITSLVYSYIFPELQVLILTILAVFLAAIYQIGYTYAKQYIRSKNERDFVILEEMIDQLEEENSQLRRR